MSKKTKAAKTKSHNYQDRDLAKVNPNTTQFEPTDASPIRQHQRMAGEK